MLLRIITKVVLGLLSLGFGYLFCVWIAFCVKRTWKIESVWEQALDPFLSIALGILCVVCLIGCFVIESTSPQK